MDAKDLRTETTLSDRKDGSKYSQSNSASQQANRTKTYQDIGTNPLAKTETAAATVRPCAVIGPDRVLPPPNSNDAYLKKGSIEPWPSPDNIYSQLPEYHHKISSNPSQMRNISPRQTFQENMQRIMMPPAYNSVKNTADGSFIHVADRTPVLSKNPKPNMASEAKYCDVPYTVNQLSNDHKSFRESDISVPNVTPPLMRTIPHGWPPNSGNLHAPRTYSAHEVYPYQQYPSCAGPRPPVVPMGRPRTFQDDAGYVYPDTFYQDPNLRFKSYPQVKDRYPQPRFDYIGNYANPYHPPPTFPPHKYDIPKPGSSHQYPMYPHLKYLDNRGSDPTIETYQRPSNQPPPGYNMTFRNQVIHPTYPGAGNAQAKVLSYSLDSSGKPIVPNKLPYDSNKLYIDYDNARNKSYTVNDPYFLNEVNNRILPNKNQIMPPNYPTANMHHIPNQPFLRKDIHMKSHEYMPHFRNFDPSVGGYTMIRHPSQFSPNTVAISPTDSNTSNDTTQTQGTNQEDCGYVSQSSSASVRSIESGMNRMSNEYYKRHDYRYGPIGNPHMQSKQEVKGKKQIDVRQFLQMWNEGDDDNGENHKESIAHTSNVTNHFKQDNKQEQLYVLGLVNVPSEELSKYEHIQKVSKLPENIKGYNSIELLKQFEEVVESSNINSFKSPVTKDFHVSLRDNRHTPKHIVEVLPRPLSPLDVEAKISQSVIHKEVGCNFEIKPCSPKMLNVEIPAPVQNVLGERAIEKVSNPLSKITESSISVQTEENSLHNNLKRQTSLPSYEKSSCKILSSPFANHSLDHIKTDYSIQDLETNSGVCLASLPRLDNEIELNFPEVNQQFIDANKIENITSKEKTKTKENNNVVETNCSKENVARSKDIEGQNNTFSQDDSQKELSRLNKYKKSNSGENSNNAITAVRTDSVIIKNPETLKNTVNSPHNDLSNLITEEADVPVNLTSHIDGNNITKNLEVQQSDKNKNETYVAIDFSLNKNDVNRSDKMSKRQKNRNKKVDNANEKDKLLTNYVAISSNNAKTPYNGDHIHESHNEADIRTPPKDLNISNHLPNIGEDLDNLNEYSCKTDFEDVMAKLTTDYVETNGNKLESHIALNEKNENATISSSDVYDGSKSKCFVSSDNEQCATSSIQRIQHNNFNADFVIEKEIRQQVTKGHKAQDTKELKVTKQNEFTQHHDENSVKGNLIEKEYIAQSVHQFTKFENLDIDERQNNLDLTEVKPSITLMPPNQKENVGSNTDELTEENQNVKQFEETENINTDSLSEKDETEKCKTDHLEILVQEHQQNEPKLTDFEFFESDMLKEQSNIINNCEDVADDLDNALRMQVKENEIMNSNKIVKSSQNTTHECENNNTQENMTLDAERLSKGQQNALAKQQIKDNSENTQTKNDQNTIEKRHSNDKLEEEKIIKKELLKPQEKLDTIATPEIIETDVVNKTQNLTPGNQLIEKETSDKKILSKNERNKNFEQYLNQPCLPTITEKDGNNILVHNSKSVDNQLIPNIKLQHPDNKGIVTNASTEENHIKELQLKDVSSFDTEPLVEQQSIEIKPQYEDNGSVETDVPTVEDQCINEELELKDTSSVDTEMLVDHSNVDVKPQHTDTESEKTEAPNVEDTCMTKELKSKDSSNVDSEILLDHLNMNIKPQYTDIGIKKTDVTIVGDQYIMSQELKSEDGSTFDTEMLDVRQNVDIKKPHYADNGSVKTDASTVEDQCMSQELESKDSSSLDTEIIVDQQNVDIDPQHKDNGSVQKDSAIEDRCKSPGFQSEHSDNFDAVTPIEQNDLHTLDSIPQCSSLEDKQNLEDCSDSSHNLNKNSNNAVYLLENIISLTASLSNDSSDSKQPLQINGSAIRDIDVQQIRNNNNCHRKELFSPQIQKLILYADGFIANSNKIFQTNYSNTNFENTEISHEVDENSRINALPLNSVTTLDSKTDTEEILERQNTDTDTELILLSTRNCNDSVLDSVTKETNIQTVINSPQSSQENTQFTFNERCDSTKSVIVEPDSNLSYSTDDEGASVLALKNAVKLDISQQGNMFDNSTENNVSKEINADETKVSACDDTIRECEHVCSKEMDNINVSLNPDCLFTDADGIQTTELHNTENNGCEDFDIDRNVDNGNNDDISEQNNNIFLDAAPDDSITPSEIDMENIVVHPDEELIEKDLDQTVDSLKVTHISLKRSFSDSALNTYAQDKNKELNWPPKRRKLDENTLEQNIINESICRLIQASRRNSISSFENEENVSFCILIDDTCILTEEEAEDKICYAEVTESMENDALHPIRDENFVTCSSFPQNDVDSTDNVIYQCQEEVNEGPWVEDVACIETVTSENFAEDLVVSSSPPKDGFNDTVISDNVAEDVVISSPSSVKYFEDDFVNVTPTFNNVWEETLVDDGVAESVVISSFLTTKERFEEEIRTDLEETMGNSPSSLKDEWSEPAIEDVGISSGLTPSEDWEKTMTINSVDSVIVNSHSQPEYERLGAVIKENVITSHSITNTIVPKVMDKVTRNMMDSPSTPKHSQCIEVVKVKDVMITDSPSASKDHLEYDDNELYCYKLDEHANKIKSIYGEKMTDGDAQIVDTLFRTPQMDENKTLLHDPLELDISAKLSHMEYSDDSLSETSHQKNSSCIFPAYSNCKYDITDRDTYENDNFEVVQSISKSNAETCNVSNDTDDIMSTKCIPQDKTVHSCESSAENVFTYDDSSYTSSSPEVSSTTSEERNSSILLKITNLNGSRISQINEIKSDRKPRCKFTEKKEYSSNRFPNRPLITKAAQKYIPPVKEPIRDLKVKISLPPQSLLKFKELKLSRNVTKIINKPSSANNVHIVSKKPKPLFEDVLKSIDEIQIKMHREKKKPKTTVPKVVIKKNEYGSHYASTPKKETFNPDLTGRKWQPWVFIERNTFIDKMSLKKKTRAIYNHRKKCYVLAEKFKKYKSASNTKFVISQPSSIKSTGQLKYTIRLKHSY